VVVLENLFDGFGYLGLVVEGNGRKEVVSDVVVRDVVKEETTCPSQKWPVDSRDSATKKRPLLVSVVSNGGVRVVEVSQHDDPVVGEQVRDEVQLYKISKSDLFGPQVKYRGHHGQADVRSDDTVSLMGFEKWGGWLEMICARGVHWGTHSVGEKIVLPAKCLHKKHTSKAVNRGLLEDVVVIRNMCAGLRGKAIV